MTDPTGPDPADESANEATDEATNSSPKDTAENPSTAAADSSAPSRDVTGSPARRPTPAASAASRARRIGGTTASWPADPKPAAQPDDEPVKAETSRLRRKPRQPTAEDATAATQAGEPVALRKRAPRTTSARDLKDEAHDTKVAPEVPQWLRWAPAVVLTVCAVAMIVIIAVSAHGVWYAKPSAAAQRDKVLAAAKRCTALANTYNYKTLAADEKRGLACTTGDWTAQYKSALDKIVKPTATQLKATQTVQINAAGVESVAGNGKQWTTIVYGQLTINQSGATPRIDPFAAIVRLDKVKSSYLVSKIDLITNPNV